MIAGVHLQGSTRNYLSPNTSLEPMTTYTIMLVENFSSHQRSGVGANYDLTPKHHHSFDISPRVNSLLQAFILTTQYSCLKAACVLCHLIQVRIDTVKCLRYESSYL
ncbi:hypothetical protein B7P43_G06046 [Cryptotermes secundus]|uniref:Uncharacterized protein n=1 Tax=Cryptotermes secundus TaxID=105785 RepID=A0A2J7RSP4_9NEOP|nr:hypothetical protein B7P43_G06046 [Cryptotermes secundus]